jgi:hypothetical protein
MDGAAVGDFEEGLAVGVAYVGHSAVQSLNFGCSSRTAATKCGGG